MTALVSFFDTATEPTEAMREAMRTASVGDDVYGRDATVNELEARCATLLAKEAAVLMPTGTMANLAAILSHTGRGDAVVVEADSHIARAETGGVATVAGCMPLPVAGRLGVLHAEDVARALTPPDVHRPTPALLCVENTHNRAGGTVTSPEAMEALRQLCDRRGLRLHVDGARLLHAAVALEVAPSALASAADSVCFALSKALGAPVGSLLLGSADFVRRARRMRKMLGGGMRQAGVLAAAGLVALDGWERRLRTDHERAAELARRLAAVPGVQADPGPTNIVLCDVSGTGSGASALADRLLARDIACSVASPERLRFVLHHQIGEPELAAAEAAMREAVAA